MKIMQVYLNFPEELKRIFEIIISNGGQCRLIGGCVRDYLNNKHPKDFDIATDLLPQKIMKVFGCHNYKVVPIGVEYGTVLVIVNRSHFEITTLRKDIKCFGRHAKVEYTNDWVSDASRRDFTMNALSITPQSEVYDYFGGQQDLQKGVVKFVGNPPERIREDFLRIMRFFRFLGYFGLSNIDSASYTAAIDGISNLRHISRERIKRELLKLLGSAYAKDIIIMLNKEQVLKHIGLFKTILDNKKIEATTFRKADPIVNLAILIILSGNQKEKCLDELKHNIPFSNKEQKELASLVAFNFKEEFTNFDHYKYWYEYGKELYLRFLFVINSINPLTNYMQYFDEASSGVEHVFPVRGKDLQKQGYKGKIIGQLLNKTKEYWHRHNHNLSKVELLDFIQKLSTS